MLGGERSQARVLKGDLLRKRRLKEEILQPAVSWGGGFLTQGMTRVHQGNPAIGSFIAASLRKKGSTCIIKCADGRKGAALFPKGRKERQPVESTS